MLASGSTSNIAAGLQIATIGNTGSVTTGAHNHLEGYKPGGGAIAPSDIFRAMDIPTNYTDSGTQLTGFPIGTAYNHPNVLQAILDYNRAFPNSAIDTQAYVNTHSNLFQQPQVNYVNGRGYVQFHFDIRSFSYKAPYQLRP